MPYRAFKSGSSAEAKQSIGRVCILLQNATGSSKGGSIFKYKNGTRFPYLFQSKRGNIRYATE